MRKKLSMIISLIMVFALLVEAIPVYALDFGSDKVLDKSFNSTNDIIETPIKREVIGEIVSKREENKKYFKMNDGSEMVNTYAVPVHFKEESSYVEINNELVSQDEVYVNKKAPYTVKYEKETENGNLLELEKDGYTLSMSLIESKNSKAIIPKGKSVSKSKEIVSNIASEITYSEIKNNIDISYTTLPNKVKESIILKEKNSGSVFEYIIKVDNLEANIKEHNIIEFKDKNEIIFEIETPYMYDRDFNLSSDIDLKLEKIDVGYKLIITPNKKWLNEKERKYPVVIDPTIITRQIRDQIDDLFIYEGDDNVDPHVRANQHILRVGSNNFSSTNGNPTRSLIRFNIPALDTGDQIVDAKMALYSYACSLEPGISCPDGKKIEVTAHKVTKDWTDNNAKWSYLKDGFDPKVVDYKVFNYNKNDEVKIYEFDITSIVKDWYVSGKNNGLMLKENNEVKKLSRPDAYFFSSDISETYANARPVASITYRNQTGLEDYQTFSSHSIGNINANINNYNGNLVLEHEDLSTPGNRLPVSVRHIYNTNDKNVYLGYGNGFRLNLSQMIVVDGNYLKYVDEDGTRHWLKKSGNNFIDEDGLNLIIRPDGTNYKMEDKEGNVSLFVKNGSTWYLKEIKDTNNNKITIEFGNHYNRISKVTDATGDVINFTYTNDLLTKISGAGKEINYAYSNGNLVSITYPNGEVQSIEYNNRLIKKITAPDLSYNTYEYYNNSPYRMKKVTEYGSSGSIGNKLDFTYGENVTSIKDTKDKKTNYLFNNLGLTTSITDLGNEKSVSNAYGQEYTYDTSNDVSKNRLTSEGNLIKTSNSNSKVLIDDGAESESIGWDRVTQGAGTIETVTNEKFQGDKSFKMVYISSNDSTIYLTQILEGERGKTYNASFYAKGNIEENGGLYFEATYKNTNIIIPSTKSEIYKVTNEWKKYNFTFTIPEESYQTKIILGIENAIGTVYIDNIKIAEEGEPGPENIIDNSGFDKDLEGINSEVNIKAEDGIYNDNGNKVLRLNGESGTLKTFSKFINLSGKKDDVLNFSFWTLNTGVPNAGNRQNRLLFELYDSNGTIFQKENIQISPDNNEWQFINKYFIAEKDYVKVKLSFASLLQKGYVLFDNIGLYKDEHPNTYTYDSNGNVISSKDSAKQGSNFEYDRLNQLIASTNSRERTTLYSYNHNVKNRLLKTFNPDGSEINYGYDSYGNITSTKYYEKKSIALRDIDPNKSYYIKTVNNNLYLSASDINTDKTHLKLDKINDNAKFVFKRTNDGHYEIFSANSSTEKVVDIAGASALNEVPVQLYKRNGTNAQTFRLVANSDGTYTIQNKVSNYSKCIDVEDGKYVVGTKIQQYTCTGVPAQKFILEESHDVDFEEIKDLDKISSSKIYYLKSATNDLYIQPESKDVKNGVGLVLNNLNEYSEWRIREVGAEKFQFELVKNPSLIFDVRGGSADNYTRIQIWSKNGAEHKNQTYEIYHNKDGTFSIKTKASTYSRCLDVHNGQYEENRIIHQFDCNNSRAQKFIILEKENSRKYIENKKEYSENGDFTLKENNERDKTVTYDYNKTNGNLNSVTDSKGNTTNYEYDSVDKVTKITSGNTINTYEYNHDKISKINHNGFTYNFVYDEFGNSSSTKVGDQNLITNTYESKNGNLLKSVYGNNHEINYTYDKFDRISTKQEKDNTTNYIYDTRGNLGKVVNGNNISNYVYDLSGRITNYNYNSLFKTKYTYNKYNELDNVNYKFNDLDKNIKYTYDVDGKITKVNNIKYSYDKLNRIIRKNIGSGYDTRYAYLNVNDEKTTNVLKTITNGTDKLSYTYDNNGNIETVKENDNLIYEYAYDSLNQLVKEDNKKLNKTIVYTYDNGGNILNKKYYDYKTENLSKEINYNYENENWKDQLTSYDNKNITYDEIGNPLSYGNINYTWKNGRQLESYKKDDLSVNYSYNEDGIRIEKKVNSRTHKYYLNGTDIIFEETPDGTIYYNYDSNGITGLEYKNKKYYFIKNAQSDIIGLLDEEYNKVANYTYDSWGKIISIEDKDGNKITDENNIALINPFRYRSYYYDSESEMYYLNSRYYNPDTGRFLNADGLLGASVEETRYNLYTYSANNHVNMTDESGHFPWPAIIAAVGVVLSVNDIYNAVTNPTFENCVIAATGIVPIGKGANLTYKAGSGVYKGVAKQGAKTAVKKVEVKRWKVGEPINIPTKNGYPAWSTVRSRYWKNEAYYNGSNYCAADLVRMEKGNAPLVWDDRYNLYMPYELHHINGRKIADPHNKSNLEALSPYDHSRKDRYRANYYGK